MYGDAHNAEWKRQQPNDWIKNEGKQRDWPAQDEQDDPQEESSHGTSFMSGRKLCTRTTAAEPRFILHYE
jgi:hypothetical protein